VVHGLDHARTACYSDVRTPFTRAAQDECEAHFGWSTEDVETFASHASRDDFLDYVEILVEVGGWRFRHNTGRQLVQRVAWANAEQELNKLFDRHRFGYRIQDGEVHAISSPALDEAIVGPALLALARPGWEEADRSFREALRHQRGPASENDDALTAANAALEAALKAMGLKGATLGDLGKSLRSSRYVPSHLAGVPEMLDKLLQRSNAIRSTAGDAHGKEPGADIVPQSLVNLAIHLTGAFIVYLAEVSNE
jgi:hypothetical protein